MGPEPLVSVLMPAYNCASFIGAAIESVLAQTYSNFELLVVEDGSTDGTTEVLHAKARRDPRLRLIFQEHGGLVPALNTGLQQARGRYLARLDADDLAYPQRLQAQVHCLEEQPNLVIVGSAYALIDSRGVPDHTDYMPQSDTAIRWHNLFHCPFAHTSVMLRLEALRAGGLSYNPAMQEAEDYELWSRLLQHGKGQNLPEPLVQYRVHPDQASQRGRTAVWEFASQVAQNNLLALGAPLSLEQVHRLREWFYHFPQRFGPEDLPLMEAVLNILNLFSGQPGLEMGEVRHLRSRWLGRLIRGCVRSGSINLYFWLVRHLDWDDLRSIQAYLLVREKL